MPVRRIACQRRSVHLVVSIICQYAHVPLIILDARDGVRLLESRVVLFSRP